MSSTFNFGLRLKEHFIFQKIDPGASNSFRYQFTDQSKKKGVVFSLTRYCFNLVSRNSLAGNKTNLFVFIQG
jgi:hypothetical protein